MKKSHRELYEELKAKRVPWDHEKDSRGRNLYLTEEEYEARKKEIARKRTKKGPVRGNTNWDVFRR